MTTSAAQPSTIRYRQDAGGQWVPQEEALKISARDGESISSFLERACRQFTWYVGDEITFVLRGRHITEARIARAPGASVAVTISVHQALRTACLEVAEHSRGETRFAINADGILIHRQSTFFVERKGDDLVRLAARLGLDHADDVEISIGESTTTAQILRKTLRSGELIARYV